MAEPIASLLQNSRFDTDAFLADSWIRLGWSALFALFVLWGATWFLRHAFGQVDEPVAVGDTAAGTVAAKRTNATAVDPEVQQTTNTAAAGPSVGNDTTTAPGQTAYTEKPERLGGGAALSNVFVSSGVANYLINAQCRLTLLCTWLDSHAPY